MKVLLPWQHDTANYGVFESIFLDCARYPMKKRTTEEIMRLCDQVRETGFSLRKFLGSGHLEKVYENGLFHRLRKQGLHVEQQVPIQVLDDDGTILGDYYADLLIEECLILELKACRGIAEEHIAQILGYLRATRIEHGLLINFGADKYEIKKLIMSNELDSSTGG
jgi:GxxExxY protein